jgi:hypothetical protein
MIIIDAFSHQLCTQSDDTICSTILMVQFNYYMLKDVAIFIVIMFIVQATGFTISGLMNLQL